MFDPGQAANVNPPLLEVGISRGIDVTARAEQRPESEDRQARSGERGGSRCGGGALERRARGLGRGQRWAEARVRRQGRI